MELLALSTSGASENTMVLHMCIHNTIDKSLVMKLCSGSVLSKNKTGFVHGSYLKMSKDSDRTVTVGHGGPPEKEIILMEKQSSPLELSRVVWDKRF